jgi:hypothetical protein
MKRLDSSAHGVANARYKFTEQRMLATLCQRKSFFRKLTVRKACCCFIVGVPNSRV